MRLDPNPMFRRVITSWYDSNAACWILLAAMVGVALFSWAGIAAARSHADYHAYTWVPAALLILSLFVAVSVGYRLFRRYYDRHLQFREP
ncbi:MAG: hypothetical protein WAU91_02445 [Desulfatitalea sp.]